MLLPLLQRFPEQVRVSLFHTPNLRGLLRLLMPERFNETIGLQHIKVYLFDDNVILSGCVAPSAQSPSNSFPSRAPDPLARAVHSPLSRLPRHRVRPGSWTPTGYPVAGLPG